MNNDTYFIKKAFEIAEKSMCIRRKIGAVIVKDNQILVAGYNKVPDNLPNCNENGCIRDKLNIPSGKQRDICYALCAEQTAITKAAKEGIALKNTTIYITTSPCSVCTKLIIGSGITRVVAASDYSDMSCVELLRKANIKFERIDDNE